MTVGGELHKSHGTTLLRVIALAACVSFSVAASAQGRVRGTMPSIATPMNGSRGTNTSSQHYGTSNPLGQSDSTTRDSNAVRGLVYHKETPDSVLQKKVFMFNYDPTSVWLDDVWNPTLSPTGVQLSDRLDAFNGNYYLGKGIVGHPHYGLFPDLTTGISTALQPDPNEGYAKRPDNIWFYQTMTPFTILDYQSSLDKDYQLRIAHTQNIRPGWNISFDYNLICPEGVYTSSGTKNHYLDATTNYFSPDSRLQATAGIIWQSFNIDENGGIADDIYFTSQLQSNRAGIPVNLYNNGTLHRETAAFVRATYNLVQQQPSYRHRDSLAVRTIADSITVVDTIDVTDTIYPSKPRTLNAGVIGAELSYDRRKRVFTDSTLWVDHGMRLFWTNDAYPDYRWNNPLKITVGINPHTVRAIIDDRDTLAIHDLYPFANISYNIGRSTFGADAMLNGNISGPDYYLCGHYKLDFDSAGNTSLTLSAAMQNDGGDVRINADALANQGLALRPIKSERYELNFSGWEWLDISVRANHMSHNFWYDTSLTVHQGNSDFWLFQAALSTNIEIGWLHIDMQQLLQHSTDQEQMPLPLWASKNSVYAEVKLFNRALTLQTGIDVRYLTAFNAPSYDYRTGLFVHQDEVSIGNYYWGDVFVNIQVKRASIYVKGGHINALWESNPNYFTLPHYPGRKFGLFWGITWLFFD